MPQRCPQAEKKARPLDELVKVGVKLYCRDGAAVPLVDFIPVFHRWIQTKAIPDMLLDVADYSHVPEGPGVILVCHEGTYAIDESHGRRGLMYYRRRPVDASLTDALRATLKTVVTAGARLEEDLRGSVSFAADELVVFANDRLLAPNDDKTRSAFRPYVEALAREIHPELTSSFTDETDPRERLAVTIKTPGAPAFAHFATRIAG